MNNKILYFCLLVVFGMLMLGETQEVFPQKSPLEVTGDRVSAPKLYVEKGVFLFGENVGIRGEGFEPFEAVSLKLRLTDETILPLVNDGVVIEWVVITDEKGGFASGLTMNFEGSRFMIEAVGAISKTPAVADLITLAAAANLDQCRNGTQGAPVDCTGANWVNGNLNGSQAHYVEGESVPYRLTFNDLTLGPHTVTIEYDTTESGKHALDYLTTFNRTELTADPCSDVAGCNPAVFHTWPIPLDNEVIKGPDGILGTSDDIAQAVGHFTLYGGTITGISGYSMNGIYVGSSQTRITLNFTATVANPVLAWGGHIATRGDWGVNNSAIAISGAPYHMRLLDFDGGGGNQDRSLQSSAVFYPGRITIIKDAQPDTMQVFGFTAVGPSVGNFLLDDDGDTTNTNSNTRIFGNLTNFGAGHTVTVTEDPSNGYFELTAINCTSDPNGGEGINNNVVSLPARQVEIFLEEGEFVTCTFVNAVLTAANVSIGGQVLTPDGRGIFGARLTLIKVSTGERLVARTNPFGFYNFTEVAAGEDYIITVYAKQYVFINGTMNIKPFETITDLNFQAVDPD